MIPHDFDELMEDYDIFYRIEPDGSISLTGDKTPCIFMTPLKDGSRLEGGISKNNLAIFGERVTNQGIRYKITWLEGIPSHLRAQPVKAAEAPGSEPSDSLDTEGLSPSYSRALSNMQRAMTAVLEKVDRVVAENTA